MNRTVIINSYQSAKEAMANPDFAGRPQTSIPMKIASEDFRVFATMDYNKDCMYRRKLSHKTLFMDGSIGFGMKKIEEIVMEEVDTMCTLLSNENGKPVLIDQYLGKENFL